MTNEQAKKYLDWLGQNQPEEDMICPRCGERVEGKTATHALSRYANVMVCDHCGGIEALEQAGLVPAKPLKDWAVISSATWEVRE